jgi:dCMP deaminase
MKRLDYISWQTLFMATAQLAAMRSKDPNTQVGACIVNSNNVIIGIGYNGFPRGCSDDELPWCGGQDFLNSKYPYVCHAELNAIANAIGDVSGTTMYSSLFPCNECAKLMIQNGIKKVYYLSDKYHGKDFTVAARKMFDLAGVKYEQFVVSRKKIEINLEQNE